jgi:hypothetical protein
MLSLAACGGDAKGVTQPAPLSPADFTSMTDALATIIGTGVSSGQSSPSSDAQARASDVDFHVSAGCAGGGEIVFVGIVSAASAASHYAVSAELRDCAARGGNGEMWVFNTKPTIALTLDVARNPSGFLATGAETGTIEWSDGANRGTCAIDVTSSALYTASNKSYDVLVNGTVCGVPVDKHTVEQGS